MPKIVGNILGLISKAKSVFTPSYQSLRFDRTCIIRKSKAKLFLDRNALEYLISNAALCGKFEVQRKTCPTAAPC